MGLLALDPVDDRSPGHARRWVRAELVVRHLPAGLVEDAVLVVSELVTNSARYVGGRVVVGLQVRETDLQLLVQDAGVLPLFPAAGDGEHGRGLPIVAALTASAVCEQGPTGKRVTCTFLLPSKELAHA